MLTEAPAILLLLLLLLFINKLIYNSLFWEQNFWEQNLGMVDARCDQRRGDARHR